MGVTQLWQILAPVAEHRPLTALRGQTLAVDLSIWVCETQCVKQMQGIVSKPFLRNLFFRIVHLSQLGVRLVFVIEGSAPEIKWETMMKRQQTRFPGRQGKAGGGSKPAGSQNRRNFNACLKECCELLDILGIPYVQSKGEAEAMCALLNSAGLVDGCLTNDGDAFLYGATTVYRNFTMNAKDPHVEMYRTSDIEGKLGIDRGGLVALGLLIGCDFVPKGVPGIGLANAVKLLQSLKGTDVLERLKQWRSMPESSCLAQIEVATRRKALDLSDFPQMKVINEFMIPKDRCPSRLSPWKRPVPAKLQEFALLKLEWPAEYTLEKVLPLTTLWDMQDILQSTNPSCHQHLKPHRIVKTRVRQGEPCFEVEWSKPVTDTLTEGSTYVTVECQDIFSRCYPHIVECFVGETESKNKAKGKKKKKKKKEASTDVDNLSFNFHKMNLAEVTNKLAQTVKDLPTEFDTYSECNLVTKAKQPKHLTLESVSAKPASGPKATSAKRSESDQDKVKSIFNFDKKSAEAVTKPTKSPVETLTTSEGGYVPLSERVKLRMQNKAVPCVNPNTSQLSDMSSLLEEVENLSLIESKLKCSTSSMSSNSKVNTKFPLHFTPVTAPVKAANLHTLQTREMSSVAQKMSSPFSANICSPMSFIRQSLTAGGQSPIPKSSPSVNGSSYATDSPSQLTPNVHKPFAEKCTAEKIAARLESGIMNVGKPQKNDWKNFSFFDKGETLPKCATSTAKTPVALSVKDTVKTPKLGNQSLLDYSSLGLDASQFGNFEIQTSLLNSLCSSLIQALTPKGVTMSKEEYENLMSTLKEIEKEDEIPKNIEEDGPEVDDLACAIDFSAIEKASSELKKMKTGIVLDPIRLVGDAQVVENVEARSKSARKKLRRKEKHRALEDIAHLNNMSQRILNNQGHETQSKQGKVVEIGKDRSSSLSAQKMESTASRTKSNSCDGNRKLSINDVDLRKTEQDKCKNTTCSNVNDGSTRNVSSNGSSKKKNNLLTDRNTSKCKLEAQTVTSCSENKTVPPKSQAVRPSTTDNAKKCAAENDSCKSGSQTQKVETIKRETADSKEKQKAKSAGKEPLKPAGKPCSTSYSCHKAHNSPESASESSSRPNIGKPGLVMEPFTVSKSPCPITSPQKDAKKAGKVFPSPSICKNILSEMNALFDRDEPERKKEADVESVASGDSVPVKKKKKKKIKKASSLINMSEDTSLTLCKDYLKNALEKFKGKKIIQKASPVFDLSADESILELESLSSKLVGVSVEKEKANRLALLKKRQMLAEKEKSLIVADAVTKVAPVLQLEAACQPCKTSERSDCNEEETGNGDIKPLIPVGLKEIGEEEDIFEESCLPKFEEILDPDDIGDDENDFGEAKSTSGSHWEELEENTKEDLKAQKEGNICWGEDNAFTANAQDVDQFVAYSDQSENSDSEFEGSDVSDKGDFGLDQANDVGMKCYDESSIDQVNIPFEADDKNAIQKAGFQNEGKVNNNNNSKEIHNLINSVIRPLEALTDEKRKRIDEKEICHSDLNGIEIVNKDEPPDQSPERNNIIWTVEDLSGCSIGYENKDYKSLPVYGKMQLNEELTEKYESADEEIFVDASGDAALDEGMENVDVADISVRVSADTPDGKYTESEENGSVFEKENYAKQSVDIQPVSVQSPACLAERLKLRLQKKSVRSVLETFTNGKFE